MTWKRGNDGTLFSTIPLTGEEASQVQRRVRKRVPNGAYSVLLKRSEQHITFCMAVNPEAQKNPEVRAVFREIAQELSVDVFAGQQVVGQPCTLALEAVTEA